jgi:hypothetical protein
MTVNGVQGDDSLNDFVTANSFFFYNTDSLKT